MNIIDIFAGVGGLSYGFKMAGYNLVAAVEYNPAIAKGLKLNDEKVELILSDVRCLNLKSTFKKYIGKVSVIVGGPPCQGSSQKGQRATLSDERNFLFKYFFDAVNYLSPEFFLLENVPNILTTNSGIFKDEIINSFEAIGYEVKATTLNAYEYGVPQQRTRAFFVGRYKKNNFHFPKPSNKKVSIKDAIYDLPFIKSGEGADFFNYKIQPSNHYQELMRKGSDGVHNHWSTKHSNLALHRLSLIPKGKGKEVLPKKHLTKSIYSGTWCRMLEGEPAVTLTTRFDTPSSGRFTHPILDRCITVREAARIQSFPDQFIFCGNKSIQMKQVGNAVPPLLAKAIALQIKKAIHSKVT